ncbi:hypothetical protein HYFRA_00010957 [Hymenoscyphus fraxineus]|uniref:Uncharacterized protein n=1 Tax=Hymenoscyphus fraxineus TaxID=746836 RepID=A0A9N9KXF0_9HELO|nr:hypothetical protein HYFRA_00010957 [Hymenoscyphus fraxineus]
MSHYPQYPQTQQTTIPMVGMQQPPQHGYVHVNEQHNSTSYPPPLTPKKDEKLHERVSLKVRVEKIRKRLSALSALSRGLSSITNLIMFVFMAFTIFTFYSTRDEQALGRSIWAKDQKTWPTFLVLAASFVTFCASLLALLLFCCCFKRAANSWKVVVFTYAIQIAMWLLVTFLYRYEKRLNDLWGWSCSDIAWELQHKGNASVNFDRLCDIQTVTWYISLIETIAKILFAITSFILLRKNRKVNAKLKLAEGLGEGATGLLSAFA